MEEIWKDIEGYEGLYQISNLGRVKSLKRRYVLKEKILSLSKYDSHEYSNVSLIKNRKQQTKRIHRLVAQAFIPNPNNLPEINHKNGIKTDNKIENLEWVNHTQNIQHAYKTGLNKGGNVNGNLQGEKISTSKLTEFQVLEIRKRYSLGDITYYQLAAEFNIDFTGIGKIIRKERWKHLN